MVTVNKITAQANAATKYPLAHSKLQPFFKWVNGVRDEKDGAKHRLFCLSDITRAVWPLYLPLQVIGLVSDKFTKLARAWYGICWAIIYSCLRPWKNNAKLLPEIGEDGQKISPLLRKTYEINEHFRLLMGSIVTAIYGGGALGMLWSWIKEDDDSFDRCSNIYQTGMMNQTQIFASMNAAIVMQRSLYNQGKYDSNLISDGDKNNNPNDYKARYKASIENIDTILFIPNIITRALGTLKLFGSNLNEGIERLVNSLGYFSYGTWASRFGIVKETEHTEPIVDSKALDKLNPQLDGLRGDLDKLLYNVQKYSGKVFWTLLPGLSWSAAIFELFGLREVAEKLFKLEGICERLNPAIASWCLRYPWLSGGTREDVNKEYYVKSIKTNTASDKSFQEAA